MLEWACASVTVKLCVNVAVSVELRHPSEVAGRKRQCPNLVELQKLVGNSFSGITRAVNSTHQKLCGQTLGQ